MLDILISAGRAVRARREAHGWSQRELAERAGLSLRFLAELERGSGNISLARFADVAAALGVAPAELLAASPGRFVSLLGVRGAGKSTVGEGLAERWRVPFVELDDRVARAAGLSLAELFELHGEAYYRRLERDTLRALLAARAPLYAQADHVVDTSGVGPAEVVRRIAERVSRSAPSAAGR